MTEMPHGWRESKLEELIALNPKNDASPDQPAAFMPMARLGTDFRSTPSFEVRPWSEIASAYVHFGEGDVLLAKITPCFENGKAGVVAGLPAGIGAGSSEFFVCRPHRGAIDPGYLLALFKTPNFLQRGAQEMTGSVGHKRVPKSYLLNSEIPLPPLPEQQRIVAKLNTLLGRVDACRERLERVGPLIKRFRQSVLSAAVTGRLFDRSSTPMELGWRTLRADVGCLKVQSGGTPKDGFSRQGIPFLKVYNIVGQSIDFDYRPQYVTPTQHNGELRKSQTQPGDVLMNIVGPPLGKVAVVPETANSWNINQAITLFRAGPEISADWLHLVLLEGAPWRSVLDETKGSVGQVNISLSQCRAFEIPVPAHEEQRLILKHAAALLAWADRIEQRLSVAGQTVRQLTPATLAKAFRGELVPQDPTDEPADQLLARIRAERASAAADTPKRKTRTPAKTMSQQHKRTP